MHFQNHTACSSHWPWLNFKVWDPDERSLSNESTLMLDLCLSKLLVFPFLRACCYLSHQEELLYRIQREFFPLSTLNFSIKYLKQASWLPLSVCLTVFFAEWCNIYKNVNFFFEHVLKFFVLKTNFFQSIQGVWNASLAFPDVSVSSFC